VPAPYKALFRRQKRVLESHRGWDPGALELARVIARALEAPLIATAVSRLVVECNRSPDHPQLFSEFTRGLSRGEKQRLLDRHYYPHRGAVEAVVRSGIRTHGSVIHIGVHSFTPVLNGRRRDADVGLLYDPKRPAETLWCDLWIIALARVAPELHVRRNYPYRGTSDGLITALRGRFPARRYLGIELEVNQARLLEPRHLRSLGVALAESLRLLL
jgi:predicted N-formylglutamate amidohydrolase